MAADALDALLETALGLARSTTSGRIALAAAAETVPASLVLEPLRPVLLPAFADAAARAREPLRPRVVERVLREAWDEPPGDVLDDLSDEPVAVTATSQVHRGVLDGAPVAVKVQRPGLAEVVRADLALLDTVVGPVRLVLPRLDVAGAVREIRARTLDELDLESEASAQRRTARALRGDPELVVPEPVLRLCHPSVLVAAWIDGAPLGALAGAPPAEREAAARALVRFHVGSARRGLVHADPSPRHVLRTPDGRFAFLDFGATREVAPARVDLALVALDALADEDGEAFGAALAALGWLPASDGPLALELAWRALEPLLAGPAVLDVPALAAVQDRAFARVDDLLVLATRAALAPEDLLPARMLGTLALVLAPLAVELDWVEVLREAAAGG